MRDTTPKTIEEIRAALFAIHHLAIGKSDRAYMSIPADPDRDADLILLAAIDELEMLRKHFGLSRIGNTEQSVLERTANM